MLKLLKWLGIRNKNFHWEYNFRLLKNYPLFISLCKNIIKIMIRMELFKKKKLQLDKLIIKMHIMLDEALPA